MTKVILPWCICLYNLFPWYYLCSCLGHYHYFTIITIWLYGNDYHNVMLLLHQRLWSSVLKKSFFFLVLKNKQKQKRLLPYSIFFRNFSYWGSFYMMKNTWFFRSVWSKNQSSFKKFRELNCWPFCQLKPLIDKLNKLLSVGYYCLTETHILEISLPHHTHTRTTKTSS